MNKEFEQAYLEIKQDPQPVYLTLSIVQGLSLLSAIQLVSIHPHAEKNTTIQTAIAFAKRLESQLVSGSKILADIATSGWQRTTPTYSAQETLKELRQCGGDEIIVDFSKMEAWSIVCVVQLAFSHEEFALRDSNSLAKSIAVQIQDGVFTDADLNLALKSGWDTRFDRTIPNWSEQEHGL